MSSCAVSHVAKEHQAVSQSLKTKMHTKKEQKRTKSITVENYKC